MLASLRRSGQNPFRSDADVAALNKE